jgi:hypothetical protein
MRAAARGALVAIGLMLIGIMPVWADVQILNLRLPLLIEKTEVAVPRVVKGPVQKASLDKDNFVTFGDCFIDKVVGGFSAEGESIKPNTWIGYAATLPRISIFTKLQAPGQCGSDNAVNIFFNGRDRWRNAICETQGWFTSSVLVVDSYLNRLAYSWLAYERNICRANPCTLRTDDCLGRGFGLPSRRFSLFCCGLRLALGSIGTLSSGIGGLLGSLSLSSNWVIDLYHFMNLPADSPKREGYKTDRDPFSKLFSAILALFFFAIGNALILYGLNKSREIGGWAALIVFCGFPFFLFASIFLIGGVFNWAGGLRSWGL